MRVPSAEVSGVYFQALYGDGAAALEFMWEKFVSGDDVFIEYAPNGVVVGEPVSVGRAIMIDMSFTTSLDQVGEFTLSFDGSGPLYATKYIANTASTADSVKLNGMTT